MAENHQLISVSQASCFVIDFVYNEWTICKQ